MRAAINDANPSAEPFTGAFDEAQKKELNQKQMVIFDKNLEDAYISSIEKAKFLIKLAVPK